MGGQERDASSLKGRSVSVWWPQQDTFLRATITDYNKDLGSFECHYGTGGIDHYLMIQSYEEDDKGVRIMQHYLLDTPDHWKPTNVTNDHRRVMLGNPGMPQVERCKKCHHCVNLSTMKQACHQARAVTLAHFGHYGAQVSSQGPNAVGTRVSIFWPEDKSFYDGFVTDWNMFTWKHQILYDDGDVEERTLYKEKVRVCTEEDTAKIVPGWLPDDVKDIASFSTKGRFRSRELKEGLVGNGNVLVYCDENKWRPAKVTGYSDADQAHKVEYTDGAKPHAEQMVYTKHVMFVLQPDGNGKREATLDLDEVPSKKVPRFDGPDEAGPQRADGGAGPSGAAQKSTDNPLMQSTAEYSQIMLWVSEFLRHDPRVPRDAQKLMAIHEEVQQGQVSMGLNTSNPDMYYGHTFTAMGMSPEKWQNEAHATQAVQSAPPDMLMSFRCSQGLINTLFYPSRPQSATRRTPAAVNSSNPEGEAAVAAAAAQAPDGKAGGGDSQPGGDEAQKGIAVDGQTTAAE